MAGNIPQGYSNKQQSRVGGTPIKDRRLSASPPSDWSVPFPSNFTVKEFAAGPWTGQLGQDPTGDDAYFRLIKGPAMKLSELLEVGTHLFKDSFHCLWMACR
jgi:hypothetical protein